MGRGLGLKDILLREEGWLEGLRVEGVVGGRVGGGRRPEAKAVSTCDKTLLAAPSLCPLISTNNINRREKSDQKS